MFLAHIPAGYLTSKAILTQFRFEKSTTNYLILLGLIGSVSPDFDMFYFYLVDDRQHSHHSYWTHIPFYWVVLLCMGYVAAAIFRSRILVATTTVFVGCALIHMLLDTFAGGIQWLHPLSNKYFSVFTIPARYDDWVWNYVLHWTALIELSLIVFAIAIYANTRRLN